MASNTGKKVPTLSSEWNYASFGKFKEDFGAYLSRNEMFAWSSLVATKMPDEYPQGVPDDDKRKTHPGYLQMKAYGIENEFDFITNSEKAWGNLYEATRSVPELCRIVTKYRGNFKLAFGALEEHIRGNTKTASRNVRRELMQKFQECNDINQIMPLITLVDRTNEELKALGSRDEISDENLYEEMLDVVRRTPEIANVYQLARMSSSNIDNWDKLRKYLNEICASNTKMKPPKPNGRGTLLSADRGRGRGRGQGRGRGGRANSAPPSVTCYRCGGNHYSTSRTGAGCTVPCKCDTCGKDDHATAHHDLYEEVQKKRQERSRDNDRRGRGRGRGVNAATRGGPPATSQWLMLSLDKPQHDEHRGERRDEQPRPEKSRSTSTSGYVYTDADRTSDFNVLLAHDLSDVNSSKTGKYALRETDVASAFHHAYVDNAVYMDPPSHVLMSLDISLEGNNDDDGDDDSMPELVDASDTSSEAGSLADFESADEITHVARESHDTGEPPDDVARAAHTETSGAKAEWELSEPDDEWEHAVSNELAALDTALDPHFILLDSGAYVNCTGDLDALDMSTVTEIPQDDTSARTAEGHEIKATMKGVMPCRVKGAGTYLGDDRVVGFTDVYYMPDLPAYRRIISPGFLESRDHIDKTGVRTTLDTINSCIHMYDKNGKSLYSFAIVKDYTWYIPSVSVNERKSLSLVVHKADSKDSGGTDAPATSLASAHTRDTKPAVPLTPAQPKISSELFHRRLLHAGPTAMSDTSKNSVGVALSDDPLKMKTPIDEECLTGKGHKTAADTGEYVLSNLNMYDESIGEMSFDFHGPYPPSKRGNIGFFNFIANDSNAEISIPVKSVSELETAYNRARMELGKAEYLRMDNQQNLVSNDPTTLTAFETKRLTEGTKIKRSAPGHQSQDGLAEVAGRFAYEASTAQLADASLPTDYWDWAVEAYSYVKTRTGMHKHNGKTPHEVHYGVRPFVGHLRVLFCPAFPVIDKEHRERPAAFTSRVKRCIFVGYPPDQKPGTYLLLNLETKRIITSRDVYFDEDFRFVEKQKDRAQWLFRMDKGFDTVAEGLTFQSTDDIEAAFDSHTAARGSVGDNDTLNDTSDKSNHKAAIGNESANNIKHVNGSKLGRSQLDGIIRANPNLHIIGHKKPGSKAGDRFAKYKSAKNVKDYFWLGGTRGDLKHDIEHGIVIIEDDTEDDSDDDSSHHLHRDSDRDDDDETKDDETKDETKDPDPDPGEGSHRPARTRNPPPANPPGTVHPDGTSSKKSVAATDAPSSLPEVLKTHLTIDFSKMDSHFYEVTKDSDAVAMKGWKDGLQREVDGVVDSGSLSKPMKLPRGKKGIKCRIIGKQKSDGTYKWRLVPKGFMQTAGIDYDAQHIDAPVVDKTIVRSIMAIGNDHNAHMRVCDVFMAFLNAELIEEVYMYPPPGIDIGVDDEGNPLVFRLLRAVYGLKQSPAAWNDLIDEWLKTKAPGPLEQNPYDRCFFHGHRRDKDGNHDYMLIAFHVDDFLIVTTSKEWETEFMSAISSRFEVKDLGSLGEDAKELLGWDVKRTPSPSRTTSRTVDMSSSTPVANTITISCPKALKSLLKSVEMTDSIPATTPASEPKKSELVSMEREEYKAKGLDPPAVVGSVQWSATSCRPDLTVISSILGTERHDPTVAGIKNMERMLHYIAGTVDMGITYRARTRTTSRSIVELVMYADSDWAGDIKVSKNPQARSRGGYVITLNGNSVHWSSKLRTIGGDPDGQVEIDLASASAEVGTLSEGCRRLIWLIRTLRSAGFTVPNVTVYEDNQAAIRIAENQTISERTRHIHNKDMFVRNLVRAKEITLKYIKSADNIADFFTKILSLTVFRTFRDRIMGME